MSESSEEEFTFEDDAVAVPAKADAAVAKKKKMAKKEEEESSEDEPIIRKKKKRASATEDRVKMEMNADDADDDDADFIDDGDLASPKKKKQKKERTEKQTKVKKETKVAAEKSDNKKRKKSSTATSSSKSSSNKKIAKAVKTEDGTTTSTKAKTQRDLKKLDKTERLQFAIQSFLWWNAIEPPAGCQWVTMEHAGVSFPETYQPHHVKMLYDGQPITLTLTQEEAATFFAAMDPDGMHLGNPKTASIFIRNFFADFLEVLGKKHVIREYAKCDFEPIRRHLNEQKMIRKAVTDAERLAAKEDRNTILHQFGYALVDGHLERVGNYNMEPPGTFRGRGEHPKMGRLKSRVQPEQVSLNLSEGAPVPKCPVPGHAWSDVRHDPRGQWLATWKENINKQVCVCVSILFHSCSLAYCCNVCFF